MDDVLTFSVIIPTHNRPRLVAGCLRSVLDQSFCRERYDIVVVDDGSGERTARALEPFRRDAGVRVLRQRRKGWGAARLLGAQHSGGDVLVFLDDDCVAPAGWLARIARDYDEHPEADGVAGGLRADPRANVAGRKQYLGHLAYFERMNRPLGILVDEAGRAYFTFGGNRSFRREVWLAAQPDDPMWYWDDTAIDLRLREMDAWIHYEPAAWVTHHYVLGVTQRMRAAFRYGWSERRLERHVEPPSAAVGLLGRWRRMRQEAPQASWLELAGYAVTQPLVWMARRLGRAASRHTQGAGRLFVRAAQS